MSDDFIDGPGQLSDASSGLAALGAQIEETLRTDSSSPVARSSAKVQFRAENEELPPQDTRYVVTAFQNHFPEKNVYSWAEIQSLFEAGVQVAVKK